MIIKKYKNLEKHLKMKKSKIKQKSKLFKINKKIIIFILLFFTLIPFAYATNVSLNYVYNGTDWIPWLSTSNGKPQIDLNLLNITAGSLVVSGNATFDTNTLYVDATTNRVGIGTISPSTTLDVNGTINVNNNKITNVATPTDSSDVATKGYADALGANYVTVSKSQKFTENGTFTIPNNVTLIWVTAMGAGGGGGGGSGGAASSYGGGGGGGGGSGEMKYRIPINVISSQVLNVTIGVGGKGGAGGTNGSSSGAGYDGGNGANTIFGNDTIIYVLASGGNFGVGSGQYSGGNGGNSTKSRGANGAGGTGGTNGAGGDGNISTNNNLFFVDGGAGGGGGGGGSGTSGAGGNAPNNYNYFHGLGSTGGAGGVIAGGGGGGGAGASSTTYGGTNGGAGGAGNGAAGTNGTNANFGAGGSGGGGGGGGVGAGGASGAGGRGGNGTIMIEWIAT